MKKSDAESLGPPPKFQVNIKIQLNADRVSRLSFRSYDYDQNKLQEQGVQDVVIKNKIKSETYADIVDLALSQLNENSIKNQDPHS